MAIAAEKLASAWISKRDEPSSSLVTSFSSNDIDGWPTKQRLVLLDHFSAHASPPYSDGFLQAVDSLYGFTHSLNSEISYRWQMLCIRCNASWILPHVVSFLTRQGVLCVLWPRSYSPFLHSRCKCTIPRIQVE